MGLNVAVVGGGLSGMRAALTLARAGCRTTLLEKNRHLGGRVFSFATPDFGEVDIGQHIWLRGCTALEQFLRDLAVPDEWVYRQDRVAMIYRWPDGHVRRLGAAPLPGSLAMLPVLLRARLSLTDKLRFAWGMTRARLYSDAAIEALDGIPFAQWLRAHHQPAAAIAWFWEPFVGGVCNGRLDEVSARHGLFAVRESVLKSAEAGAICLLRKPLSEVFDRLARQALQDAGVQVRTGASVSAVRPGQSVTVCSGASEARSFDRVILALPLRRVRAILPGVDLPPAPQEGAIAGLLLRFARPVMEELFFSGVGSPVQIVFNKSAIWGRWPDDGSQVIEIVLSAAEREIRLGVERAAAELVPALGQLLPAAAATPILARRLLVHGAATFRVTPGGEAKRLQLTGADTPNVAFAGDFAATGWPSTMESAVRAGQAAAAMVHAGVPR
jgi:squalene-associated FAD-dependent desaturase